VRPIPPFRLDLTVWALRRRPRNHIDRWDGSTYRRVIRIGAQRIELAVRQTGAAAEPRVIVHAAPAPRSSSGRVRIEAILDRLLGLHVDVSRWYALAARDERLRRLAERFRGVKPPRFPTIFEALVNAFACQQLSLEAGLELLNRLETSASGLPCPSAFQPRVRLRLSRRRDCVRSVSADRRSAL